MLSPYGLDIIESCLVCKQRAEPLFCHLSPLVLQAFDTIKYSTAYPKGAVLFVEGQAPRGIFVVCRGTLKLSMSDGDGTTLIVQIAEPGEVLGLSSTVSGKPYELTAETMEPCQVNFVKRNDFLRLVKEYPEACFRAVERLSAKCRAAWREVRWSGSSGCAEEKLAKLLVDWSSKRGKPAGQGLRIRVALTHEEIAEMIGTSRESVTRAFADLRKRQIVQVKGSVWVILNKPALQQIASA